MKPGDEVAVAKETIDWAISNGSLYVQQGRKRAKCCLTVCVSPCFAYSTFARLVSCPFQCLFNSRVSCNPIFACLTDSQITIPSDRCIQNVYKQVDEKRTVNSSLNDAVNREIIKYAAAKIEAATNPKIKYVIAEAVQSVTWALTFSRNVTPGMIVQMAAK